jgi:hypothetical protein
MRVRSALRAVALSTTLAGLLVLPVPSAAAAAKSKPKASAKSAKSTGKSARSTTKSAAAKSSAAKASAAKASTAKAASPSKAAFDPVTAPSTPIPAAPPATASTGAPPQRGPTRIDFDDRLIQGQTNKSGAVYLYDRKELKQRSMIKKRESFREEIVGAVYDSEL